MYIRLKINVGSVSARKGKNFFYIKDLKLLFKIFYMVVPG